MARVLACLTVLDEHIGGHAGIDVDVDAILGDDRHPLDPGGEHLGQEPPHPAPHEDVVGAGAEGDGNGDHGPT